MSKIFGFQIALAVASILQSGCTSKEPTSSSDPAGRLKAYVEKSFSVSSPADRKAMLEFLSGDAKERLESWSDEQFAQAFLDQKRKFEKLALKDIRIPTPQEAIVTYELTYLDVNQSRRTQKKAATLGFSGGNWKIQSVRNLREIVEYQNELTIP